MTNQERVLRSTAALTESLLFDNDRGATWVVTGFHRTTQIADQAGLTTAQARTACEALVAKKQIQKRTTNLTPGKIVAQYGWER